ncbi:hypothetical protein GTP91_19650 [Rugamonas sp. FT82W]|uniref:DUF4304 domain-containing protein n=1 Tax=Duganella vulcania TaxID=2692166 RepID=A0A845G9D0_9BURK|nr:hypothetical protein [Duganella vulcania]MYM89378.1 hypothetical protein [Duganella vulcania]
MIGNWEDTKARVVRECGERLLALSYKYVKSRSAFEKSSQGERRAVNFLFTGSNVGNHWMSIWCSVRNDAIESIFHRTSGIDKKSQPVYSTINFSTVDTMRVDSEKDVDLFIAKANAFISETAIPFIEQPYSYPAYSDLLNSTPESAQCRYHANPQNRCHYGLIAAKLSNDPRYEDLKRTYLEFFRANNGGAYLPRFERLLADLERV